VNDVHDALVVIYICTPFTRLRKSLSGRWTARLAHQFTRRAVPVTV